MCVCVCVCVCVCACVRACAQLFVSGSFKKYLDCSWTILHFESLVVWQAKFKIPQYCQHSAIPCVHRRPKSNYPQVCLIYNKVLSPESPALISLRADLEGGLSVWSELLYLLCISLISLCAEALHSPRCTKARLIFPIMPAALCKPADRREQLGSRIGCTSGSFTGGVIRPEVQIHVFAFAAASSGERDCLG